MLDALDAVQQARLTQPQKNSLLDYIAARTASFQIFSAMEQEQKPTVSNCA